MRVRTSNYETKHHAQVLLLAEVLHEDENSGHPIGGNGTCAERSLNWGKDQNNGIGGHRKILKVI